MPPKKPVPTKKDEKVSKHLNKIKIIVVRES